MFSDTLSLVDEDGSGVSHDPLQMLQLVSGKQRLGVQVVADEGSDLGSRSSMAVSPSDA